MDILTDKELDELISNSKLVPKYNDAINRESAYEILTKKLENTSTVKNQKSASGSKTNKSAMDPLLKVVTSATFVRGVFGILNKMMKK